ncbi:breast carcinoma-amplified sequence 4 isoform X5 [Ursus maritimus]|uniref:Breast carcinoma-amplified sequence 4 isoform X5 n=1 Tax=Ursus maritimus TaxID=29073 RepID=A0A8M1GHK9_URSMA|nr:breast carcinoma-amplified sequence 4 isoform X5 [Ursus maritimus]
MGGAPRPGRGHRLPGGLRQLDPVALLMLLVDADRPEPVSSGARELALFLTPEPGAEAKEVEETIEGMLLRLEEFCSLTDMAFVKMVGHHVSFLEAHVLQAERDHGAFSQALRRWLGSTGLPSFRNKGSHHPELGEGCLMENLFFPAFATKIRTRQKTRRRHCPSSCPRCTARRTTSPRPLATLPCSPPAPRAGACEPCRVVVSACFDPLPRCT